MNKGVLIGVVIAIILLGGVGFMMLRNNQQAAQTTSPTATTEMSPAPTGSGGVVSSIKDALSKSLSLECTFTDEQGRQTKSFVKNGAIRADITSPKAAESGSVIMKDKTIYFWNAQGGFKMAVPEGNVTPPAGQATAGSGSTAAASVMDTLEKYKDSCKPGVVADSVFVPPAEVQFKDMSELTKPPAAQGTGVPNQEQIQKYMQQYATPQATQ